jgi:hypothetical protein
LDKNSIIAFKLHRDSNLEKQLSLGSNILERRTFDLIKEKLSKSYALEVAYAERSKDQIQAVAAKLLIGVKGDAFKLGS